MKETVIQELKDKLKPQGGATFVPLYLNDKWFNERFINLCVGEIERMEIRNVLGQPATNLEKLGLILLLDSAGIDHRDSYGIELKEGEVNVS